MKRTKQERLRLGIIYVLVTGFFVLAAARLVHLQVFLSPKFTELVSRQSTSKVVIPAERGAIYDRNGQLVAKNVIAHSLYAYPHNRTELDKISKYLDRFFGLKSGQSKKKFRLAERRFSWVKRQLADSLATKIAENAPRGLFLREETQRAYPFGQVGRQILGCTNIDNKGLTGFEYAFDSLLAGKEGGADVRRDGLRNTFRVKEKALVKPEPGTSVVLSVDWRLQDIVEKELSQAVEKYNAKSGMAVFLDCNNGDILAMAHFCPEESGKSSTTKLRAVTDQFEPGSIFKAFTAAAILDAGTVSFSDSIFCEEGKWRLGRRTLHDDKELEWLSFRQVMELSSNIGIAKCALTISGDELYDTYHRFGFGQKLRCGLPGETGGRLAKPSRWSDYNIAAAAMGHSVAASALQLATGFGAVANGGELLRPRLLLGHVDESGYVVSMGQRELIGRTMNSGSVDSLHGFLRGVVEHGTAEKVNSPVVAIAGKTGTAEIPDLVNGGYHKNRFNASFAGFFPYESPVVAGIVVLEDPRPITYGGHTAGPTFRKIAENYTVLNPDAFITPERMLVAKTKRLENTLETPDFVGRDVSLAKSMAVEKRIELATSANEGRVVWQFPPADRILFEGDRVLVAVESAGEGSVEMADLKGLPIRTAAAFFHHVGMKFKIEGAGHVVSQSIPPGEPIVGDSKVCQLRCRQS